MISHYFRVERFPKLFLLGAGKKFHKGKIINVPINFDEML
jgi:hypothetical protein